MKKVAAAVGLAVLVICTIKVAYESHFQYYLHKDIESRWEREVRDLDVRLKQVEARKVRNLQTFHLSCEISSTDQIPFDHFKTSVETASNTNRIFTAWHGKGSGIKPEFRLPAGNTNEFEFKINIPEDFGKPVDAWLSQTDVAAFDRFHVYSDYRTGETNMLKLVAQLRTNASVKMRFDIVVLCLSAEY
jgi:hypothetical protein